MSLAPTGGAQWPGKWRFRTFSELDAATGIRHGPPFGTSGQLHCDHFSANSDRDPSGSADIKLNLKPVEFSRDSVPVVLLNGIQLGTRGTNNIDPTPCPASDVSGTFGTLPGLLHQQGLASVFFDNCTECPDCKIEDLGLTLGQALNSFKFTDDTAVPVVDMIAHSMGGLIVRCYLSGKQTTSGQFTPANSCPCPQGRLYRDSASRFIPGAPSPFQQSGNRNDPGQPISVRPCPLGSLEQYAGRG